MATDSRDFRLLRAYMQLRKVLLTLLPLPYELPELHGPQAKRGDSFQSVVDAYSVLPDLPGDPDRVGVIASLMLDWLTAVDMTRHYLRLVQPVYRDAADAALERFEATMMIVDNLEE